jgi:hypothetical protein
VRRHYGAVSPEYVKRFTFATFFEIGRTVAHPLAEREQLQQIPVTDISRCGTILRINPATCGRCRSWPIWFGATIRTWNGPTTSFHPPITASPRYPGRNSRSMSPAVAPRGPESGGKRTPAGTAMFQMLGVFAQFERAMIRERVRAGLARARGEGKRLGRPRPCRRQRRLPYGPPWPPAGNGRANRLLHAVHQGVSSARRQLQKPCDRVEPEAGWQFVGVVGVLHHGFVEAELAQGKPPDSPRAATHGAAGALRRWRGGSALAARASQRRRPAVAGAVALAWPW